VDVAAVGVVCSLNSSSLHDFKKCLTNTSMQRYALKS